MEVAPHEATDRWWQGRQVYRIPMSPVITPPVANVLDRGSLKVCLADA
jgi:hypothetical protein